MTEKASKEERTEELILLARDLLAEVGELASDKIGKQFVSLARQGRTNRMLILATAGSVVIDLALTVILMILGNHLQHNTNRIDIITQRLDYAQTVQRQKALCPLYQIFLDSKSPQGRAAAPDPKKYDHAFVVIQQGYDALECDQYITNTPSPVTPAP